MPYYPPKPRTRGYYTKKTATGMRRYKKAKPYAASVLQAAVRRAITKQFNKKVETKHCLYTAPDGTEILHNNFVTLSSALLATTQGVTDPDNTNTQCRIGDNINLRGVSIKMMLELNERYSDVTFRIIVVRCAKGDVPTRSTLFCGISGNKMLDRIANERYSIIAQKFIKMKAPNNSAVGNTGSSSEVTTLGLGNAGIEYPGGSYNNPSLSRATRLVKIWIPGTKFNKSGVIQYENNSSQVKFFDYYVLCYAYSNYTTLQDVWNVGRINDYFHELYFKDP